MIPFDKQISSLNCILSEQQPQFLHHWSGKTTQRQPDTHARNFGSITLMPSVRFCCWFSHCSLHFSLLNAQIVALSKSLSTKMESQWVQGGWHSTYNYFGWSLMHHFLGGIFTKFCGLEEIPILGFLKFEKHEYLTEAASELRQQFHHPLCQ